MRRARASRHPDCEAGSETPTEAAGTCRSPGHRGLAGARPARHRRHRGLGRGLEALEQFLRHVPAGSGLALVIVQHLDPTHKGIMPELLQRATGMKVVQVKDRTRVRPNCVYVIPPNKDLSILHGVLHLLEPAAPRGLRLPIDFFLRSLAQDQQERSIGVILSGMGSDGTLGLRAIKEKAGWCWCRNRRRPSSTACRAARSTPGWRTSWRRRTSCPARSSPICNARR